jgi:hypothetical protein
MNKDVTPIGTRLILAALSRLFATMAGALQAVERLAPDLYHAADGHLPELRAVLHDAQNANRRRLDGQS